MGPKVLLHGLLLGLETLGLHVHERRLIASICICGIVEQREDLEILLVRDWVVLVGMTLRASHRRAHPNRERCAHAIDDRDIAKLFVTGAAFVVGLCIPMKGGGNELVLCRVWQEIASKLFPGKDVEWFVLIE